jgi:hypothetical protein
LQRQVSCEKILGFVRQYTVARLVRGQQNIPSHDLEDFEIEETLQPPPILDTAVSGATIAS